MKKHLFLFAFATLVLLGAACGGAEEAGPTSRPGTGGTAAPSRAAAAPCSPSGTTLEITAKNTAFDKDCLAAPADQAFTIKFNNQDGIPHNIDISGDEEVFVGKVVTGPTTVTYKVKPVPAGEYSFQCDVHPPMNGTFVAS